MATPAGRFGALFADVQMRNLFGDGKILADAVARTPDAAIVAAYSAARRWNDAALRRFVEDHFILPEPDPPPPAATGLPIAAHIAALWPALTRAAAEVPAGGSAITLPHRYVVPGGRFRELYYWDSYFTMLGLARDGHDDLIEGMIENFGSLIARFGHIPNGTRTYYLGRSQPPFFHLMLGLSRQTDTVTVSRRLGWLRREHDFWMTGADTLAPGAATARVVRLADGSLLNRYWDASDAPRDESWREDVLTARKAPARPAREVYRDLRAAAESGWDFSARWLSDGGPLESIMTTAIVPVDLNALLWSLERAIASGYGRIGGAELATRFHAAAARRKAAINRHLWAADEGRFVDHDWRQRRPSDVTSAAMLYPLFTGLATADQAAAVSATVQADMLAPGGMRTTLCRSEQQWDAPNGWAPLQWIAVDGFRRYGQDVIASTIAHRFLATVDREYKRSG